MKNQHTVLFINPIERISPQGRHLQTYTLGSTGQPTVNMKKTREEGTASEIDFELDHTTNKLKTGLDEMISNPYRDLEVENILSTYSLPAEWQPLLDKITAQNKISKQIDFEIRHGQKPGTYTSDVQYTMNNLPARLDMIPPKTVLQSTKLILYPRPNRITNETPRQELLLQIAKNSPLIATTKVLANSTYHDWYISEEHEAEIEKSKRQDIIEDATYHLVKLKKEFGVFRTYQVAILLRDDLNNTLVKGEVHADVVNNRLSDYISTKSVAQMDNIEKFNYFFGLLSEKKGVERFEVEYLVQQAINTNVIVVRDGNYIWHSKAGTPNLYKLSSDHKKVIQFFLNEYKTFNKKEQDVSNWYADLYNEVKQKGVRFE